MTAWASDMATSLDKIGDHFAAAEPRGAARQRFEAADCDSDGLAAKDPGQQRNGSATFRSGW